MLQFLKYRKEIQDKKQKKSFYLIKVLFKKIKNYMHLFNLKLINVLHVKL